LALPFRAIPFGVGTLNYMIHKQNRPNKNIIFKKKEGSIWNLPLNLMPDVPKQNKNGISLSAKMTIRRYTSSGT